MILNDALKKADLLLLLTNADGFKKEFKKVRNEIEVNAGFLGAIKKAALGDSRIDLRAIFGTIFDNDAARVEYELKKHKAENEKSFKAQIPLYRELLELADSLDEKESAAAAIIFACSSLGDLDALRKARDEFKALFKED